MDRGRRVVRQWDSSESVHSDAASSVRPVRRQRLDQEERIRQLKAEVKSLRGQRDEARGQRDEAQARYQVHSEWSERTIRDLVVSFRVEVQHVRGMITDCRASIAQWGQGCIGQFQEGLDRELDSVHRIEGAVRRIIRGTRVPRYEAPVVAPAVVPVAAVPAPVATAAPVAPVPPPTAEIVPVPAPPAERRMMGVTFFSGVPQRDKDPLGDRAGRSTVFPRVRETARKRTIPPPPPVMISEPAREAGPYSWVDPAVERIERARTGVYRDLSVREIHGITDGALVRSSSSGEDEVDVDSEEDSGV